jgi:hypothetical protein
MINENLGTAKDYANAKVIADMEEAQASFMEAKAETQSQRDRILWELESCGGNMPRSTIVRRTKLKQTELDSILEELEREDLIKRTRLRTDHNGPSRELISLKVWLQYLEIHRAFTVFQLMTILEEARHSLILIEHDPLPYEDAQGMVEYVSQALSDAAKEATVLLYSPGTDTFPEDLTKNADRVFYFDEVPRATTKLISEVYPRRRRTRPPWRLGRDQIAVEAWSQAPWAKAEGQSYAHRALDGQAYPRGDLPRQALGRGGNDTEEAGGEELEERELAWRGGDVPERVLLSE